MDYIGKEKLAAINAEIEKTRTLREELGIRFDLIERWADKVKAQYNKVKSAFGSVASGFNVPFPGVGGLPSGQFGIPYVPETGAYLLHKGETVTPAGRGGGVINFYLSNSLFMGDFEEFSEKVGNAFIEKLRTHIRF